MALTVKSAFSAGELDPALHERTTLDKYRNGLATGRNWIISKDGTLLTRAGRMHFAECRYENRDVRLYSPPGSGVVMEWGHEYVQVYSLATWLPLGGPITQAFTEDDLPNIHFDTSGSYVYAFCAGKNVQKFNYATGVFTPQAFVFLTPSAAINGSLTAYGAPTGYPTQYAITYVINGEESAVGIFASSTNLPIAPGESVAITGILAPAAPYANQNPYITEMRVYRRPFDAVAGVAGGAFGYIGSATQFTIGGGQISAVFSDLGGEADYTHQPPTSIMPSDITSVAGARQDPGAFLSNTGIVYQQRLIITDYVTDLEAMYATQPGYQGNFYRNYPLDAASALKFKCGTSGYARVLRLLDSDGLVAFTSAGIYLNQGALTPDNITMNKKGKWIINPIVPPLAVPGGVMFLDRATNGIRNLLWSFELNAYDADEVSIFSNHLFRSREFRTWNFQEGAFPLLWVVFSDGIAASFTYDYNQQMRAWTRHDSQLEIDSCCGTTNPDQTFFVVKKTEADGTVRRFIEVTVPRYVPPNYIAEDPDYKMNPSCAYMDGIVSETLVLNESLDGDDEFEFATTEVDSEGDPDWGGILNLTCGSSDAFFPWLLSPPTDVNDVVWRFFDRNGSAVDVVLVEVVDANLVRVRIQNMNKFPSEYAQADVKLYTTFTRIFGLGHMIDEYPAVIVDGGVLCSPNNDRTPFVKLQVKQFPGFPGVGYIDLPPGVRAAICHVGRPIVGDIETLDIDTVEQAPTLLESLTVNKIYVKTKDAKGLYIGPKFPDDDGVEDMVPVETLNVPLTGNRTPPEQTKRFELMIAGGYSNQGKVCIRQVDPLHAEILSIIPDVEIHKRSDR